MTWRTDAEFKDIEVTVDGKRVDVPIRLEQSSGNWTVSDGVIRQNVRQDNRRTRFAGMDTSGAKVVLLNLNPLSARNHNAELQSLYARLAAIDELIASLEAYDRYRATAREKGQERRSA